MVSQAWSRQASIQNRHRLVWSTMTVNGMVRPCSCPASDKLARGAKTRSTPWLRQHRVRLP